MKPRVLVAMSGGVDSSVAAAVLAQKGYEVIGLTMQIWQESQRDPRHAGCCSLGAVEDARRVAAELGIPHYVINLKEEFKKEVIDKFVEGYARGETPNPCVECNRKVKFELLFEKLEEFGCDLLATGHYARIADENGRKSLLKPLAKDKDQTYVLYMLGQNELGKLLFPMGEFESKSAARDYARQEKLCVADKPDSQDICFVSEAGGYREFLKKARPELAKKGEIVGTDGAKLGEHDSITEFTIGQRKGIRIASEAPLYVLKIIPESNQVVVGKSDQLNESKVNLHSLMAPNGSIPEEGIRVEAKIRYNMDPRKAVLYGGSSPYVEFEEPVRAVTPGQVMVAYQGEALVAGGIIKGDHEAKDLG